MGIIVVLFVREKISLEVTSAGMLTALLLFGHFFPLLDANGKNQLDAVVLLSGFSNPSLLAVLALLVMGQGMIHTDALRVVTNLFAVSNKKMAWFSIVGILVFVMVSSAFLNNTPLVIITIPLVQSLAASVGLSDSRVMIPLSYVAILGGMMTLIGSSTNLLVASTMTELGYEPLQFFDFIVPGSILAAVGFVYVIVVVPRLLPDRSSMARVLAGDKKEFVAELDIASDSKLIGMECEKGKFSGLADLNVKLIQRGGYLILPPFEGYIVESGDALIVSATRETLTKMLSKYPGFLLSEEEEELINKQDQDSLDVGSDSDKSGEHVLAEVMITPASRMIDMSLENTGLHKRFNTIVLGVQRRAKVVRRRIGRIRLEAGDSLLVAGKRSNVDALRDNADFIVLSGSKRDLLLPAKAPIAAGIFLATVGLAAIGVLSIPVAAISGAVGMVVTGCLNVRQAMRAIDRKIFLLVGAMLALGTALQVSGGACFIAEFMMHLPFADIPLAMVAVLFIAVAITTNILTNNACAILFTPIAMSLANSIEVASSLQVDLSFIFAVTVLFAANCSFASPIGYQTNLLVMGPGHYRFRDFIKGGAPLVFILWGTYILIVKYYFGL
ncbi:MAG: SLC13 family permease [Alphaproteobacteria bacterium]|nr:SLC13 family permease [Alphaproteobacteria bacterium]